MVVLVRHVQLEVSCGVCDFQAYDGPILEGYDALEL